MTVEQLEIVITANSENLDSKLSEVNAQIEEIEKKAENALKSFTKNTVFSDAFIPNFDTSVDDVQQVQKIQSGQSTDPAQIIQKIQSIQQAESAQTIQPFSLLSSSDDRLFKIPDEEKIKNAESELTAKINTAINFPEMEPPIFVTQNNGVNVAENTNAEAVLDYYKTSVKDAAGYNSFAETTQNSISKNIKPQTAPVSEPLSVGKTAEEQRIILEVDGDVLAEAVVKSRVRNLIRTNGLTE